VTSLPEPYLILIRDPVIHHELDLTEDQVKAVESLAAELDPELWTTRNLPPQKAIEELRKLTKRAENRMYDILEFSQRKRLEQIRFRVAGLETLLREDVAAKLDLSADQENQIGKVIRQSKKAADDLRKEAQAGKPHEEIFPKAARIAFEQDRKIAGILTREQRARWRAMIGSSVDVWRLGRVKFTAPELRGDDGWANCSPLTLGQLRGKIVAVHFWSYGNLNCVHDYPHYRAWHASFGERGLAVVGIHTPETNEERDTGRIRGKVAEAGLGYPVLIDNARKNWNAWGNSVWPALYLIDRQGNVRYWWLGELSAEEGQGEKLMRRRIEELLAED